MSGKGTHVKVKYTLNIWPWFSSFPFWFTLFQYTFNGHENLLYYKKFNFVEIPRNQFTDHPHFAPRLTLTFRLKCQSWRIEKFNYKHLMAKLSTTTTSTTQTTTRTWRLYKIVKWKMPWLIHSSTHPSTRRGKLNACQTSRWNIVVNISLREEAEEWVEEELHGIADQQIVSPTKWRQTNRRKHLPYVEMQFSLFISLTFSDSFENYFPHFPLSTLRIA